MKLLFIENKYKTIFWEKIAEKLHKQGHEIYWIVQNHSFKPSVGKSYIIPYPGKINLRNVLKRAKQYPKIIFGFFFFFLRI